jgi:hypothetical protein
VSTPLPDFLPGSSMAATGREPRYSRTGTARQHHAAYSSSVQHAPVPRTTTHARTMPRCPVRQHRQTGRKSEPGKLFPDSLRGPGSHPGVPGLTRRLRSDSRPFQCNPGGIPEARSGGRKPVPPSACTTMPCTTYHAQYQQRLSGKSGNRGRLPLPGPYNKVR